jgi:general stress protein 26
VDEVEHDHHVNLSYADPAREHYVSVSGRCQLVRDRDKARELWNPLLKAWFPEGLDDPELALLRVQVEKAEYWDTPSSRMVQLVGFVKSALTGQEYHPGDNEKISLEGDGATVH